MKMKACAFTGHRPEKLPFGNNEQDCRCRKLKQQISHQIVLQIRDGVSIFITGMARGVDVWAAEAVLECKRILDNELQLWAFIPYDRQPARWSLEEQQRYNVILKKADRVEYISHGYYDGCLLKRNRSMVDAATHLIAVYDENQPGGTKYTIDYARRKGLEITIIEP